MQSMGSGDLRKHQSCKRNAIKSTKKLKTSANYIILYIMHETVVRVGCGNEIPKATDRILSKRKKFLLYGEIFKGRHA